MDAPIQAALNRHPILSANIPSGRSATRAANAPGSVGPGRIGHHGRARLPKATVHHASRNLEPLGQHALPQKKPLKQSTTRFQPSVELVRKLPYP
jgi:hypothetical protein